MLLKAESLTFVKDEVEQLVIPEGLPETLGLNLHWL